MIFHVFHIQETPLHAVINKNLIKNFKGIIQEGSIYTIKNLKITATNNSYKPISGSMKGWFLLTTKISKIQNSEIQIPRYYFEFATFQTVTERVGEIMLLSGRNSKTMNYKIIILKLTQIILTVDSFVSDIIGTLHALGNEEEVYVSGKPTKILRLELRLKE